MPLSRRASRLLAVAFIVLIVGVSIWMTYTLLTEGTDPANRERLEEVQREAEADAARDTLAP